MATARPTENGRYLIKLATQDLYVQLDGDKVVLRRRDQLNKTQIWKLTSRDANNGRPTWQIQSDNNDFVLSSDNNKLRVLSFSSTIWSFWVEDGTATITSVGTDLVVLSKSLPNLDLGRKSDSTLHKSFTFERLSEGGGGGGGGGGRPGPNKSFEQRFFMLTPQLASQEDYDIIIIGTGIGGGVLAADLFDTNSKIGVNAKKILVIEKGNLLFHSHCLNASRPTGFGEDRGQQNDTFFASFKEDYNGAESSAGGPQQWKGGPMYCLGGRSAAWGLFAPRIHDKTLRDFFPPEVTDDLLGEYYEKAEKLMKLSLPVTKPLHQHLIDRLNMGADSSAQVQWQWGRIASEFSESGNYDFAEGAYSTIDRLLEIAMSKPKEGGKEVEHKNFRILLDVEARKINWLADRKTAGSVLARTSDRQEFTFRLRSGGKVIVCAGSVHSPAILLRSGVSLRSESGCHLTDHDIYFKTASFRYPNLTNRQEVGAMKLQTYANIGNDRSDIALVNMSIDASTFLPRSKNPYDDLPQFIMVFIMRARLAPQNDIVLEDDEPVVTIRRSQDDRSARKNKEQTMEKLTRDSIEAIRKTLKVDFVKEPDTTPYFKKLELGGVAHELGSIPMQAPHLLKSCLDDQLKLLNYEGVYVCDLSVFPYSPEANPTLTLAALSLRLSRMLVPRLTITVDDIDTLYIINHSGRDVQVFVSNRANVSPGSPNPVKKLEPGWSWSWKRQYGKAESVSIFRINPRWKTTPTEPEFWDIPELLVGNPGQVLPIL